MSDNYPTDHRANDEFSPYDRPQRHITEHGDVLVLPDGHDAKIVALLMTLVEVSNDAMIHDGGVHDDERFSDAYSQAMRMLREHYNEDG